MTTTQTVPPASQEAAPKTFMSPLGANVGAAQPKVTRSQIEGPTNVAVKAFKLLLDRAKRNRDESGQPASFQYTLWFMIALVIIVTVVGVVLLDYAAKRQRYKTTTSFDADEAKKTTNPSIPKREQAAGLRTEKMGRDVTEDEYLWSSDTPKGSTEEEETTETTDMGTTNS